MDRTGRFEIWPDTNQTTRDSVYIVRRVCVTFAANLGFLLGHTLRKYCLGEAKMYNCLTPPTPDITKIIIYATLHLPAECFLQRIEDDGLP